MLPTLGTPIEETPPLTLPVCRDVLDLLLDTTSSAVGGGEAGVECGPGVLVSATESWIASPWERNRRAGDVRDIQWSDLQAG